jgi:Zn-dependent protease with chaperone function
MVKEPEKIKLIFEELKSKGLISSKRKIKPSRIVPNFKSGLVFYNTIIYNPKLSPMQENNIRFCLLHEEGHKVKHQYGTPGIILFLILASIPVFFNFLLSGNNPILTLSIEIYSLMFILISVKIFSESLRGDEFESDLFASTILRDSYGIKNPSGILYNTLTEIFSILKPKYSEKVSISERIIIGLLSYHPSIEDRVKNIRIFVDHD